MIKNFDGFLNETENLKYGWKVDVSDFMKSDCRYLETKDEITDEDIEKVVDGAMKKFNIPSSEKSSVKKFVKNSCGIEESKIVNEGVAIDDMYVYKVTTRDPGQNLKKLIEYIGKNGNTGHSFEIVVDPDMTEEEGKKTFYWDGDGSDYIHSVETEKEPVQNKEKH